MYMDFLLWEKLSTNFSKLSEKVQREWLPTNKDGSFFKFRLWYMTYFIMNRKKS